MKKVTNFYKLLYRFLLVIVSSLFVFAGIDKILLEKEMVETFNSLGFPIEFMVIIGFTELILAIMLQSKYFTKLASNALISMMSFAVFFHAVNGQYIALTIPLIVISILLFTNFLGQKIKNEYAG